MIIADSLNIGYKDKDIVDAFLALPPSHKKVIRDMIIALSQKA